MTIAYAVIGDSVLKWVRASGCRALPWDMPDLEVKLELRWPRPDPAALQRWMAAVIRLGLERKFLKARETELEGGVRTYGVRSDTIPELNGCLARQIEIIAERDPSVG